MGYDDVISELKTVRDAIDAGDVDELDDSLDRLNDEYKAIESAERARVARLQAARIESDLTNEQHEIIGTYERWFTTTYFGRGGFLALGDLYLLDPDEGDPVELRDQAAELADRETSLENATSETNEVLENVEVPPRIGLLSFSIVAGSPSFGDRIMIELDIENVGDEDATGVETVLTAEAFGVEQSTTVGRVEPRERQTITFELDVSAGGTVELGVSVKSQNAGSVTETETVTVRTKESIVETVLGTIAELRTRVRSEAGRNGHARSITSKLDAASESLNRALSGIKQGRNNRANNAINTGTNQLGALLNSIDEGQGNRDTISSELHTALVNHTELVIDQLADARNTEPEP